MRSLPPPATSLLAVAVLVAGLLLPWGAPARAEVASEARTPAEIFERKQHVGECLRYVARDLKARWEADKTQPPAEVVLVIDPTTSMKDEIETLQASLESAWAEGPAGMPIGVYGIQAGAWKAPSRLPKDAKGALAGLAFLPSDGPRNMLAGVREAAEHFLETEGGPKAMLLVTQDFDGGEDDIEETREVVLDCGAAFYCIAGEAAFERAWLQEYEARDYPHLGLTERYNPSPRKLKKGSLYYGGETAFGLVPYRWEFDLAQADFVWVRPPRYPVPSGFGYWTLATLSYTSGGRYFVYDFGLPASHASRLPTPEPKEAGKTDPAKKKRKGWWRGRAKKQAEARRKKGKTTYDYARMALFAPDLRPRARVLKSLGKDWRAQTIVRVWEHLANDATPVIQRIGVLEKRGGSLTTRPERPVRSVSPPLTWFEDMDDVKKATRFIKDRLNAVQTSLKWWESANGKERKTKPGEDPLQERIEADFQLLGVQLRKVRFHHGEALAALKSIKPLDVTYRRVRILPRPLVMGVELPPKKIDLGDEEREARFAEVFLAQSRIARKYVDTPWSFILKKGWMLTFTKDVQIIEPERDVRKRRNDERDGDGKGGKKGKKKPPPKPTPKPKPPAGPRPGSSGGGPVTGGK
ncbi:MAG: hypothetical protein P1V36_07345 [Planctomycetota bacterium]|nr:hypothetical protein [Planctomycetota bacterium]